MRHVEDPEPGARDGIPRGTTPTWEMELLLSGATVFGLVALPSQLDRNITVVGRVVEGKEVLSVIPRGPPPMGFFEKPEQRVPIRSARVVADLPAALRPRLQILRTETATFDALVESRRNRRDAWYKVPAGHVDLCLVPIPVRPAP